MIRRISANFIQIRESGQDRRRDVSLNGNCRRHALWSFFAEDGTSRCRREATHMHGPEARREPRRQERIVGAAMRDAPPTVRSSALANLMSYGLWASAALLLGATRSARAGDDVDPADQYGDFA
jgi:hypothetical protein